MEPDKLVKVEVEDVVERPRVKEEPNSCDSESFEIQLAGQERDTSSNEIKVLWVAGDHHCSDEGSKEDWSAYSLASGLDSEESVLSCQKRSSTTFFWYLVEFLDEVIEEGYPASGIVSSRWVIKGKEGAINQTWRPAKFFRCPVKDHYEPQADWIRSTIRILSWSSDRGEMAEMLIDRYPQYAASHTAEVRGKKRKRTTERLLLLLHNTSDEEEPVAKRRAMSRASTSSQSLASASAPASMENGLSSSPASESSALSPARSLSSEEFQYHILKELRELKSELAELKKGMQKTIELQTKNIRTPPDEAQAQDYQMPTDLGLPLQTVQDVKALEAKLDDTLQDTLIKFLSSIGGTAVRDLVKRILQQVMADKCARMYNWKGQNLLKLPFCRLKLCSVVIKAVKRNPGTSGAATADIEARIKEWLRFAAERDGGRKERVERKRREVAEERNRKRVL